MSTRDLNNQEQLQLESLVDSAGIEAVLRGSPSSPTSEPNAAVATGKTNHWPSAGRRWPGLSAGSRLRLWAGDRLTR
jgi:hypothetical protein